MHSRYRITVNDVSRAATEVAQRKQAWERFRCRVVSDKEMQEADDYVAQADAEVRKLLQPKYRFLRVRYVLLGSVRSALRPLGLDDPPELPTGLLLATPFFGLTALCLAVVTASVVWSLAGGATVFLLAASGFVWILRRPAGATLAQELDQLKARLDARDQNLRLFRERHDAWVKHRRDLAAVRSAQEEYHAAHQRHRQLVQVLNSRRYQLIHTDWRALRGTAFEDFLGEVFHELGYTVSKTKSTGDQGVDLLLSGGGRRIAVQAKGYKDSVGNKPVQEVYAGMTHYQCDVCVAVTNSHFTSGARDLARSVGCLLIDANQIPDLIEGKIPL